MSSIKKSLCSATARRGIISIIVFTVVWEICTRLHVPIIGNVPAPSSVIDREPPLVYDVLPPPSSS